MKRLTTILCAIATGLMLSGCAHWWSHWNTTYGHYPYHNIHGGPYYGHWHYPGPRYGGHCY